MPLWFCLIWGITTAVLIPTIIVYWADMFKVDIPAKAILISYPVLFVVSFLYNLFAPEKLWTVTFIIFLAIVTVTLAIHWIRRLVYKWRS